MVLALLSALGWLVARSPEWALRALSVVLGEAILAFQPRRRRLIHSNLSHAFPDRSEAWRRRMARTCCRNLVETALLSLATPWLDERRVRTIARMGPSVEAWVRSLPPPGGAAPRPAVFATVHMALWETQPWLKAVCPVPIPEFGIIYRPLDQPAADAYVKRTRERFGMKLLSRREGFAKALGILRSGGCMGLLFDQNAGMQGLLTTLLGRVCSTTELPGLLAAKMGAEVRTFYPRRTGFWRVEYGTALIEHDGTAVGITIALNRWLESALSDEQLGSSWLWAHDRWRHQDVPARRLRLESKRNVLEEEMRLRGWAELPRRTRIWVRLPNWLGDAVMALPLLRALRVSRPDAEINVLGSARLLPVIAAAGVADRLHPLPRRGSAGYFLYFWRLRQAYPDVWILFTNSFRGDAEARLAGCPQRFGIVRSGRPRPLLSHRYSLPAGFDEAGHHQLKLWEDFLKHFGLAVPPDLAPLPAGLGPLGAPGAIGLIAGSENDPAKRWPVAHWRRLIEALPAERFVLFGTPGDRPIAAAVAAEFPAGRIEDLAGKTDLEAFAGRLRSCRLLVSNDTGGMHLANALGVPVIALFGPTNPVRTGPVFSAPYRILQPPGCPAHGGENLSGLDPETVIAAVRSFPGDPGPTGT